MSSSLKLLVHLAVIGCFIGSTLTYPIDDKEEVSKFQFTKPIGLPPHLKASLLSSDASNGAIEGTISHEITNGAVVGTSDKEAPLPLDATASGQPLNQNIDQINEPVATLGQTENPKEVVVEDEVKSDITKAKTRKRSAEDDDETKGVSTAYSFRQSSQNGKITEQVFEKETNIHDSSKDSDSLVRSDSDDSDTQVDSDSDSDSGSASDFQSESDKKNSENFKYVFKRGTDLQLSENVATNFQINADKKVVKEVESPVTDQPDNGNLDNGDSLTYGRSSNDNDNAYYEGESLNFYGNSNGAQRDGSLSPSYEETYSGGEGEEGSDGAEAPEEYTDDYRRDKRSNDVDDKVLSIIKNLKGDSTVGQADKVIPGIEVSSVTDKPELDETLKLIKETEPGSDDTNDDKVEDTFALSSDKESINQETSQSYPSVDATPQRFNYRRVKRSNVFVLIAKKKGEPEETTEIPTEDGKVKIETLKEGDSTAEIPTEEGKVKIETLKEGDSTAEILIEEDKVKTETFNGGESQSNKKLEHEETPAITSNLELSNLDKEENPQENPSPSASQDIGSFTDDETIRSKRSNDVKQKLVEIKKKIEDEQPNKQINPETINEEDKLTSEFNQHEEISSAVESSSGITYSNDYGRVSRNDDIPSSFGTENVGIESDAQPEDQFEVNYDATEPKIRNDYHQEETS